MSTIATQTLRERGVRRGTGHRRLVAALCLFVTVLLPFLSRPAAAQGTVRSRLVFCCKPDNDLYRLFSERGGRWMRFDSPTEAVRYAPQNSGVLLLADTYPDERLSVPPEIFDLAYARGVRLYVEYPKSVPGVNMGETMHAAGERGVVASNWFEPAVKAMQLLSMHDCSFVPIDAVNSSLVLAKVAGFDTAVFGLDPWKSPLFGGGTTYPLLVKSPLSETLIASSKLSNFITGRYAPERAWRTIWQTILTWLAGEQVMLPEWTPVVAPAHGRDDVLPPDAELQAVRQGVQWYSNARLFVGAGWRDKAESAAGYEDRVGPAPDRDWQVGDGTLGMLEGVASSIDTRGDQQVRYWFRNDCMSESAMACAFDGVVNNCVKSRDIAGNLNDYIYTTSELAKGPRSDPQSPSYGLVGWSRGPGEGIYYGDDNARSLLGTIAVSALQKKDAWDANVLRCLLANFRTTGPLGFRPNAIQEDALQRSGWRHYFNLPVIEPAPHYQAYLWAAFLWGYKQTGYTPFLERTKIALQKTMEAYPDQWKWTNGIQQERARMLLPLSWLVRIEDTPEHRDWLKRIATDLIALQVPCGAIQEQFGAPGLGTIPPPKSNAEYGKTESPIIQENGDPACDLLYTCNFALMGLHEAAAATGGDAFYADAEKKLAEFLCRIQIRSEDRMELDGGWYRAFDFKTWEYWGSNGDNGWGAWSIETGWTQGWICSALALRQMKTSFWDLASESQVKKHLDELVAAMLPGAFDKPADESVAHLAVGKPVTAATPYTAPFSGGGNGALTDGRIAKADHTHPAWQGVEGVDLDVTIDLGAPAAVKRLQTNFLQSAKPGVLLPASVEYSLALEPNAFKPVGAVSNDVPPATEGPVIRTFAVDVPETQARYVRVVAKNVGVIPEGLPGKGKKALLFADEIVVQ